MDLYINHTSLVDTSLGSSGLEDGDSTQMMDHPNVQFIILMSMLAIFSVVGSIGNGLVIFVFQRVREKTTAQIFIIAMAVIDLFTCTVIIPLTMFMEYSEYKVKYDAVCKLYQFLITSKIPLSAFIMVAIAFDRYFCICHPLKRCITIIRAKAIVVALTLLASTFGVITSLFYGVNVEVNRIDGSQISQQDRHNMSTVLGEQVDSIVVINTDSPMYQGIQQHLIYILREHNYTVMQDLNITLPYVREVVYLGICHTSQLILSHDVFHPYHKSYTALFAMCLVTVMVLYFMIYRFMCARRSKKLKQKLVMCSYVNGEGRYLNTLGTTIPKEEENGAHEMTSMVTNVQAPASVHVFADSNGASSSKIVHQGQAALPPPDPHLLSPMICGKNGKQNLSASCSMLSSPVESDFLTNTTYVSPSTSCLNIDGPAKSHDGGDASVKDGEAQDGSSRRNSRQEQKYRWYKKRDSVKRYKGRKWDRRSGQRASGGSREYDPDRLREENRKANVKTAIMLFTVTLVYVIAYVPSWVMAHRLIPYQQLVFYLYFSYNVANPFIYAFMNHIFKSYMRKVFSCREKSMFLSGNA